MVEFSNNEWLLVPKILVILLSSYAFLKKSKTIIAPYKKAFRQRQLPKGLFIFPIQLLSKHPPNHFGQAHFFAIQEYTRPVYSARQPHQADGRTYTQDD